MAFPLALNRAPAWLITVCLVWALRPLPWFPGNKEPGNQQRVTLLLHTSCVVRFSPFSFPSLCHCPPQYSLMWCLCNYSPLLPLSFSSSSNNFFPLFVLLSSVIVFIQFIMWSGCPVPFCQSTNSPEYEDKCDSYVTGSCPILSSWPNMKTCYHLHCVSALGRKMRIWRNTYCFHPSQSILQPPLVSMAPCLCW